MCISYLGLLMGCYTGGLVLITKNLNECAQNIGNECVFQSVQPDFELRELGDCMKGLATV